MDRRCVERLGILRLRMDCASRIPCSAQNDNSQGRDAGLYFGLLLLGEEIVEGFYGGEFVVFDVKDGVELGYVQDVVNFFAEVEELQVSAGVADGGEAADEFADAGRVDEIDLLEIENDFLFSGGDQASDGVAEAFGFIAECDAAVDVENGDVADFARCDIQAHSESPPASAMLVGDAGQVNGTGCGDGMA